MVNADCGLTMWVCGLMGVGYEFPNEGIGNYVFSFERGVSSTSNFSYGASLL